jgi:hypothetical protein
MVSFTLAARALAATSTVTYLSSSDGPVLYSFSRLATVAQMAGSKCRLSPNAMSLRDSDPSNSIASCFLRSSRWKVELLPDVVRLKRMASLKAKSRAVGSKL